jgi:FlaA1/EpsC-like NDP-sugar epimerase
VIFSMFLASLLQIGLSALVFEFSLWVWTTLFCVIFNVCFFHLNRTYVGVIRYSSFIDISRIFISLTLGYLVTCVGNLLWIGWSGGQTHVYADAWCRKTKLYYYYFGFYRGFQSGKNS